MFCAHIFFAQERSLLMLLDAYRGLVVTAVRSGQPAGVIVVRGPSISLVESRIRTLHVPFIVAKSV